MAETPPAPTPKPSAVNVSPSALRQDPSTVAPPPVETPKQPEAPKPDAQLEARAKELEKAHARISKERRELAEQRKSQKAQADEYAAWKTQHEDRRRNPSKYLAQDYGENWYDVLTKAKLEGSPPAELIASEMDARVASLQKQMDEKAAALEKRFADAQAEEAQRAKRQYLDSAKEYARTNADKYQLLAHFKEFDSIPAVIEGHFRATCKQDDDGNWLPGETLSHEEAAKRVEEKLKEIAENFRGYFAEEAKKKGTTPQQETTTQRRDSTPPGGEWKPPKDDAERWRRAMSAGEAHMAARKH